MNLYKVESKKSGFSTQFIVAESKKQAIIKFLEVYEDTPFYHDEVTAEFLCERDSIVPCVDPLIEFPIVQ